MNVLFLLICFRLLVIGFHHIHGPIIEFSCPPLQPKNCPTIQTSSLIDNDEVLLNDEIDDSKDCPNTVMLSDDDIQSLLPFLALPDASHHVESGFVYFTMATTGGSCWDFNYWDFKLLGLQLLGLLMDLVIVSS